MKGRVHQCVARFCAAIVSGIRSLQRSAPLIGGEAKTGAKIMGHSAQTFMRYVRANDETARVAVEKMAEGFPCLANLEVSPDQRRRCVLCREENGRLASCRAGIDDMDGDRCVRVGYREASASSRGWISGRS
jgi:hypothetical protein